MSLAKGRKIVVGEATYRWKVSARGGLHVAIEKEGERGRHVVWLDAGTVVTPGSVRKMIEDKWY
jgi:predicted RNA binding protein YcfA (HicA-like mRNA interferase family)